MAKQRPIHHYYGILLLQEIEDIGLWAVHRTWHWLYPRAQDGPAAPVDCPTSGGTRVNHTAP